MATDQSEVMVDAPAEMEDASDTTGGVVSAVMLEQPETPGPAPPKKRRIDASAEPEGLDKPLPPPRKRIGMDEGEFPRCDYDDDRRVGDKRSRFRSPGGDRRRRFSRGRGGRRDRSSFGRPPVPVQTQQEMAEQQLRDLVARIGDQVGVQCEDYMLRTVDIIEVDIRAHGDYIVSTLVDCAVHLPFKTAFYACFVGLLNMRAPDIGAKVVTLLQSKLKDLSESDNIIEFTLMMLFAAELTNWRVIDVTDFMTHLRSLLELALSSQTPPRKADFAAYIAMSCVSRCGKYFFRSAGVETALFMLKEYFEKSTVSETPRFKTVSGQLREDSAILPEMHDAFHHLSEDEFILRVVRAPHRRLRDQLERVERHSFSFQFTSEHSIGNNFRPLATLELLPNCALPSRLTRMDMFVLVEQLFRSAYCFHEDPKEAARRVLEVASYFQAEYLLVEMCLSRIVDISIPCVRRPLFWANLLIQLLKNDSNTFAPLIGRAANTLFRNLVDMDIEARDRFTDWFSFHISNFSFQWPWSAWSFAMEHPHGHPQKVFLQEAVAKVARLSYWDRIQDTLKDAPQLEILLTRPPEPVFRFSQSGCSSDVKKAYENIRDIIRRRELLGFELEEMGESQRISFVVQSILDAGSKSYSHTFRFLDTYADLLKSLASDIDAKIAIINEVAEVWTNCDQHILILVDRLHRLGIVDSSSVIAHVFSDSHHSRLHKVQHWRLLFNVAEVTVKESEQTTSRKSGAEIDGHADAVSRQQKDMFLMVMQRFVLLCSTLMADSEDPANDFTLNTVLARLKHFLRKFLPQIVEYESSLRDLVFVPDTEQAIMTIFTEALSVGESL